MATKAKAGMIHGVRSPMATSGHGLVGSKIPPIAKNIQAKGVSKKSAPIRSPFNKGAIV